MKWILLIYFTGSSHIWGPHKVLYFPTKQECIEARDDLRKNAKELDSAICAPERV